jgi:outer membrane receptor protein involved in Fe transport
MRTSRPDDAQQNSNVNDAWQVAYAFTALSDARRSTSYALGPRCSTQSRLARRRKNQLVLGASFDASRADFLGEEQEADFDSSREAIGISDFQTETKVRTRQNYFRVYATDTLALTESLFLTGALSYTTTTVSIEDSTGTQPALNGRHSFSRWLPAAGLAWSPAPRTTYSANASTGMRAPTAIELTCADPPRRAGCPTSFSPTRH